jgi:hypothetical protein
MKVSAFTFIKNGQILGYPFLQSIQSILPIVDEFIINVGKSEDNTLDIIKSISSSKIHIIESNWNQKMQDRGYIYGQQKMISQFNCSGDWVFYIEGDEVYHENHLDQIKKSMELNLDNLNVEALVFDFFHFYGNTSTLLNSPGWYRSEARIIRNSVRSYAPDGLFWLVLDKNKKGRYPKAKHTGVPCFHYGWIRSEEQMNLKIQKVQQYWGKEPIRIDYSQMDSSIFELFKGSHPRVMDGLISKDLELYKTDPNYKLTKKQKKHRLIIKLENFFGKDFSKKHYKLIK